MNELDIFSEALDLTEPGARQDFLDQACAGQPELRQRIEGLLKNAAQRFIFDATKACELTHWMDEAALDCLAAAYAEAGDFAEAIRQQEKAIALCPVGRRPKFEARLELYKQSQPFREPLIKVVCSGSGM